MDRWAVIVLALSVCAFAQSIAPTDRAWRMLPDPAAPALYYGIPDSDDLSIGMTCAPGEGRITVTHTFRHKVGQRFTPEGYVDGAGKREPWPASMTLRVGRTSANARGEAFTDELHDGTLVKVVIDAKSALWDAFSQGGPVLLEAYGERSEIAAGPVDADARRRFVAACRAGRR